MIRRALTIGAGVLVLGAGIAGAVHVVETNPANVPQGFLAAHNDVADISALGRVVAVKSAAVFVQHARITAPTPWHTHPGPAVVTVVSGSLIYERADGGQCQQTTYAAGSGFVDPGFGHVHRALPGAAGFADFYVTYILPRGSESHLIPTAKPTECPA